MEHEINPENEPEQVETDINEPTMEALLAEQGNFQEKLNSREVVWVKVVQVQPDQVLVDIGEKHEGAIPAAEFEGQLPKVGGRVPAILQSKSKHGSPALLSYRKARAQMGWEVVVKAHAEKARVRGIVTSAIKGGFLVDVNGVSGFLPASLADLRPVRKPETMIKTGVRCYIIELNKEKKQIVLSRKAVLEEETKKRKDKLLSELKVGTAMIGRVTHSVPSGVFLNVGGLEGFIPTSELAWKDPEEAKKKIEHGSKLRAKVLRIETETGKVTLGVKQLTPNPADHLKKKFAPKSIVQAKVVSKDEKGVTLELQGGFPGYCEASELPYEGEPPPREDRFGRDRDQRNAPKGPPPKYVWPKEGDALKVMVLGINYSTFAVTTSIRRYEEIQDRKRVAKYLKGAPPLTLGQILTSENE